MNSCYHFYYCIQNDYFQKCASHCNFKFLKRETNKRNISIRVFFLFHGIMSFKICNVIQQEPPRTYSNFRASFSSVSRFTVFIIDLLIGCLFIASNQTNVLLKVFIIASLYVFFIFLNTQKQVSV
jgi:hypothetical protein